MTKTRLVRIRFPSDMLVRLDTLAVRVRTVLKCRVSRAGLVRAMVRRSLDAAVPATELAQAIKADTVRRGREKGKAQEKRREP